MSLCAEILLFTTVLYQLAMLICLAAECTATYSLSKYEDLQGHIEAASGSAPPSESRKHNAHLHNNDLIDAEIITIVFCVLVACLYGADFFFLLFFPRRTYPKWYNRTKLVCAVVITAGIFVAAVVSTNVVARHSAYITGVDSSVAQGLVSVYYRPPLSLYLPFPHNARNLSLIHRI